MRVSGRKRWRWTDVHVTWSEPQTFIFSCSSSNTWSALSEPPCWIEQRPSSTKTRSSVWGLQWAAFCLCSHKKEKEKTQTEAFLTMNHAVIYEHALNLSSKNCHEFVISAPPEWHLHSSEGLQHIWMRRTLTDFSQHLESAAENSFESLLSNVPLRSAGM